MNKPISLEDLKRCRGIVESGTLLARNTVLRLIETAGEAAETIQRKQSAIDTLDRIITMQCDAALNATGLHHLIDEDGDGEWGAVWEALADFKDWKEQAQQSERDRVNLKNRLDAMRRQRDAERSRADKNANKLEQAKAQVARVRELSNKGTEALLKMNIRSDGLYLSQAILRALDGEPNE